MSVAPCKSCLPVDCAGIGVGFQASAAELYSLEQPPYIFEFHCPPGLDCNGSPYLILDCCNQIVFVDLTGMVDPQRRQAINAALRRCTQRWSFCGEFNGGGGGGGGGGTGGNGVITNPVIPLYFSPAVCCQATCQGTPGQYCLPPGAVISPGSFAQAYATASRIVCQRLDQGKVSIGNSRQCYTAACPGGDPFTAQRCTEANLYGECLFFPSPAEIQNAQNFYNFVALDAATSDANAALVAHGCQICNSEITGFGACPGDPTKIGHGLVAAGKYCLPTGGSQDQVDAQASQDLYNQIEADLTKQGCACTGHIDMTTQIITFLCDTFVLPTTVTGNLFAAPLNGSVHILAGQTFDWLALTQAAYGQTFHGICNVNGNTYIASPIKLYFP